MEGSGRSSNVEPETIFKKTHWNCKCPFCGVFFPFLISIGVEPKDMNVTVFPVDRYRNGVLFIPKEEEKEY